MERLTGIDATFLYVETHNAHMHVAMTGIYDVSSMTGGYKFETVKEHIRARLQLVPQFTRRLVKVPFNLHHPVWIEDPDFNLDYHVRRIGCPEPGGRRELAEVAGQIASIPLDRSCPLWEAWVIEGLKHDRIGFVVKIHHAAIDGASGAEIMTQLYDLTPEGREIEPVERIPDKVPSEQELITYAALSKLKLARDSVGLIRRTASTVDQMVRSARNPDSHHGAVPLTAPPTRLNQSIGPHRKVAFARLPLERAKDVKDALGVKLNDVILAVCAGTLRRYLQRHEDLPEEALIAMCPISVRTDGELHEGANMVSGMWASLATDIEDPGERLEAISESTAGAKSDHERVGAHTLTDWAEWSAPRTFGLASRLYGSMHLAESLGPIHNVVISNVPGPPFPLYIGGAELVAAYPMGPVMDGAGLNITVLSYREHIDIGFMVDSDLIPDVWDMAEDLQAAFDELVELGGEVDPTLTKVAAPVTATSKSAKQATKSGSKTKSSAKKNGSKSAKSKTSKSKAGNSKGTKKSSKVS